MAMIFSVQPSTAYLTELFTCKNNMYLASFVSGSYYMNSMVEYLYEYSKCFLGTSLYKKITNIAFQVQNQD